VTSPHGTFCCRGCEAVFELLASRQLTAYYDGDERPGVSQKQRRASGSDRFVALDDPDVAARFVRFDDGQVARATFAVPDVHCASGVWLLEQLWRLDPGVSRTEVDLERRALHVA
jgi:Cu+-exporting ATPase